jgi:hypothetical protein
MHEGERNENPEEKKVVGGDKYDYLVRFEVHQIRRREAKGKRAAR